MKGNVFVIIVFAVLLSPIVVLISPFALAIFITGFVVSSFPPTRNPNEKPSDYILGIALFSIGTYIFFNFQHWVK